MKRGKEKEIQDMDEEYYKLDYCGNLENAVYKLQDWNNKYKNRKACIMFNGYKLCSDTVTMDSAYVEVLGKTKAEFDAEKRKQREEWKRHEEEHRFAIPVLTKKWIEEGHKVLPEDKWSEWDRIVPIRLSDLYEGMELGQCLEIINILNTGNFEKAKEIMENQGHSGMSWGLMKVMIKSFSDVGEKFIKTKLKGR